MDGFLILLLILLFALIQCKEKEKVFWRADRDVFQFGENARLVCNGTQCKNNEPKFWMGGLPFHLLCKEGVSSNPDKYESHSAGDGSTFYLMIKNISISDFNCNYTCTCGFDKFTSKLSAANYLFYPPDIDPIYSSITKDGDIHHINVNVSRVYPVPKVCTEYLLYKGKTIKGEIPVIRKKESGGTFSNLKIKSRLDCMEHQALIDVNISCIVRGRIFNVFTGKVDCSISEINVARTAMIICLVTSLLIVTVVVAFCCLKWKRRRQDDAVTKFSDDSDVGNVFELLHSEIRIKQKKTSMRGSL